jgi:hypothetical protein
MAFPLYALTVDEIIRLKEAGVDDKTIQMLIEQERTIREETRELGVKEIEKQGGEKDKIYYSITPAEEENKGQREEREKLEKSWEMLKNIIIDERKR